MTGLLVLPRALARLHRTARRMLRSFPSCAAFDSALLAADDPSRPLGDGLRWSHLLRVERFIAERSPGACPGFVVFEGDRSEAPIVVAQGGPQPQGRAVQPASPARSAPT